MTYKEWNNLLGGHFFNEGNAGNDVYLYLSKDDIILISQGFFPGKTNEEIFADYLTAITYKNGETQSVIDEPLALFNGWNKQEIPPYIAYLILFTLPLTEPDDELYNANNYYARVNDFLNKHSLLTGIPEGKINTSSFRRIDHLWKELEEWSILTRNCELGIFELKKFGNPLWTFVGKPWSQCLLTPKAIRRFGELFLIGGLVPYSNYSDQDFRRLILSSGISLLELKDNVKKIIRDESNELGHSIIEIAKREYKNWRGDAHRQESDNEPEAVKKNYTIAPLLLQFEINKSEEKIIFSFRMFSTNDFPDDLQLNGNENLYQGGGWSKKLGFPFQDEFDVKDDFNKWIAKFPKKQVRIFVDGAAYQLSNQYWIESETLFKSRRMYLLADRSVEESIVNWGKQFPADSFRKEDLDGVPDKYSLFSFQNPLKSHPEFSVLAIPSGKSIRLVDGLNVGYRKYLNRLLPDVEINNSDGKEKLYVEYKADGERLLLKRHYANSNRWVIPDEIDLDSDFLLKIEGEVLEGYEVTYTIITADHASFNLDSRNLPQRDGFGRATSDKSIASCQGIAFSNIDIRKAQFIYENLFKPITAGIELKSQNGLYQDKDGDLLLTYLTLKRIANTEEFYKAFETIHQHKFGGNQDDRTFNYSRIKRASLNYYDYLGFIDYDHPTKRITIIPPQLILTPTERGRTALLIGARDSILVSRFLQLADKYKLAVEISKQHESNSHLLLPDIITIKTFDSSSENYGVNKLIDFSKELQIGFDPSQLVQPCLQELSCSISEYEKVILTQETDDKEYGWAKRTFDLMTLSFIRDSAQSINNDFSLVEYKLNEYTFDYRLWVKGHCYVVDRSWGKYLILKYHKKNVILYDKAKQRAGIPLELPLPRLLAKSILLLSGKAPQFKSITLEGVSIPYRIYENIPSIFIQNLYKKLEQTTLQFNL
ncbi:MAG: hypothetical protein WDO14_09825 [Bacteroidota bacterium]